MSTLALGLFQQHEHGMGRSFVLSALVHLVLATVLFLGVRWQVHAPDTVTVDLVDAPPPPPVEAPKPEPKVEPPPVVKPEPRVVKPEIVIPKKEVKKAPPKPKDDPELKKRMQEQLAMEQKALAQQQERQLRDLLARKEAEAARQAAAAARNKALNEYMGRIQAAIRQRIRESELAGISGNPAAEFDVVQIPSGDVISIRMRKSSGYPRYDAEIERAIQAASPLPQPPSRELFSRDLRLTFRPQDK